VEDFLAALGLVLVIEGALYGLFPDGMKRLMAQVLEMPAAQLRWAGLIGAAFGLLIIWLVRGAGG
jgi:uncharacterized protein YjeT (DUF2065 family)